ncbi:MAG: hypothetical protein K2G69_05390 [Muribaculaceae bacterium]|nr:hypothetical protein [Muribaculaceae bacterium]MDE5975962.1 hypothetical protein [Muribaculaceae bacterium]
MTTNLTYSDSFSFARVWALFTFYAPTLRRQMLIYFCVSFLLSLTLLIPGDDEMRVAFFSIVFTVIGWMNYLSPLSMTARGRLSIIDTLLPVKASEKLVFFLLYFWIIIPCTLFLSPFLVEWWLLNNQDILTPTINTMIGMQLHPSIIMWMMNIWGAMWIILTCLYMVLYAKRNRAIYGIVGVVCVEIVLGFLGGIYGGIMAFKKGLADGLAGKESIFNCESGQEKEIIRDFTQNILESPYMSIIVVIEVVATITMLWALYRLLRKPNRS